MAGEDGYNLLNNQRLLVSNQVPVDKTNQFVFDHWEVLETGWEQTDDKMWGYLTGNVKTDEEGKPYIAEKGQEYFLDVDLLKTMEHCFYMKADRKVIIEMETHLMISRIKALKPMRL